MDSASEASSMAQGLRIVQLVADCEKWGRRLPGVSQLAASLDMEQSRVSRLTHELCELGLLERLGKGPFRTGQRFFGLAASLNNAWVRESRKELERIVASLGLRARVSVRDGFRAVLLRASNNDGLPGSFVKPGMVTPVWCTGSGRALLWDHRPAAIHDLLSGVNFIGVGGPAAAHSPAEVCELMDRDRARGFILAAEEFEHGIYELAVPVRDNKGIILAALSVLGSRDGVEPRVQGMADALTEAAGRLSSCGAY
ncbi:IclR family transcriptional regulator [bacterium RCC_150]